MVLKTFRVLQNIDLYSLKVLRKTLIFILKNANGDKKKLQNNLKKI